MLLRRLKYRQKLLAPAAVVVLAAVLATTVTLYLSARADGFFEVVQRRDLPVLNLSHDLETLLFRLHRTLQDAASVRPAAAARMSLFSMGEEDMGGAYTTVAEGPASTSSIRPDRDA